MTYNLKEQYETCSELVTNDKSISTIYGRRPSDGALIPINIDDQGNILIGTGVTLSVSDINLVSVTQPDGSLLNVTANLSSIDGAALTLGQTTSALSLPVTIASDQSPLSITGSVSVSNFPDAQPVTGQYNDPSPILTNGQISPLQLEIDGDLCVATDAHTVTSYISPGFTTFTSLGA